VSKKLVFTIALGLGLLTANAQIKRLEGPRVGVTLLTPGWTADFINDVYDGGYEYENSSSGTAFISQYGWQWESRFADGEKVVGLVEWIALVGGMEKGLFLPSVSSLVGLRTDAGTEFAVGPTVSVSGVSMVFSTGYNFTFGELNVPVNIAYVPSKKGAWAIDERTGAGISLMVGFNMSK